MVFRWLLSRIFTSFSNDERIIQKLSESHPMRRIARVIAYVFFRSQSVMQKTGLDQGLSSNRLKTFARRLQTNFKNELESAKSKMKPRE